MIIDWSKAPVGTTGAMVAEFNGATVRRGDVEWIPSSSTKKDCYSVGRGSWVYHEAPPKWNGEGLPPVGTVCEFTTNDGLNWRHCSILFADSAVVLLSGYLLLKLEDPDVRFRPIRTAEQIAADERKDGIDAIIKAFKHTVGPCTHCLPYSSAERLYEIGVRLQVAP